IAALCSKRPCQRAHGEPLPVRGRSVLDDSDVFRFAEPAEVGVLSDGVSGILQIAVDEISAALQVRDVLRPGESHTSVSMEPVVVAVIAVALTQIDDLVSS